MAKSKVKAILDWPEPRKVCNIQSFLGFANFYRSFNYSTIVLPLAQLTRKGVPWNFGQKCQDFLNVLKKVFTSTPVLHHWVPDQQITVETDASDYAITGILSITSDSSELHPVAFHSRTLSGVELNYDTHDKELLAIFEVFKTWRHYLEGSATLINIDMDHKNLEAKPNALTCRWDVYPKEGDSDYSIVNPHNFRPVFTQEQLASSLRVTILRYPVLRASFLLDEEQLRSDIQLALDSDTPMLKLAKDLDLAAQGHLRWSKDEEGWLRLHSWIYVPNSDDL
ncbi:hypothetical protein ACG7TL_007648 [Trametes sanguinea]